MTDTIADLVRRLTLEEKASLCVGADFWHTTAIPRFKIPSLTLSDGPHGLRKSVDGGPGLSQSLPATCFPSAAGLASTWNRDLIESVGIALGEECQAESVDILLGPAVNIKRSPLGGRNFEYFSEDPYLSSEMASRYIRGVQSQGVGTSLKHFAANNQEHRRMTTDTVVDERTLHEIYLASFESAVKSSAPWTMMSAYNRLNGTFCSENLWLLSGVLRDRWGYEGAIISDWGAVDSRVAGLRAGLDLEMPGPHHGAAASVVEAVRRGDLKESQVDASVARLLELIFKAVASRKWTEGVAYDYDVSGHHQLARRVAGESAVLLKNENHILPLTSAPSVAIIGALARQPRYQGGGSSHVQPTNLENLWDEFTKTRRVPSNATYASGYSLDTDSVDEILIAEAKDTASRADIAILCVGLPERMESEGYDRKHLHLPANQEALITALAEVQPNLVVVLSNGAPIEMPWIDRTAAVLECYLGGQGGGGAMADILLGIVNPSGKLAETFPATLSQNPSYLNFPGEADRVEYRENLFVGYRYYDAKELTPLFPFGYGLSYTQFEYRDLVLDRTEATDAESVGVSMVVKNCGQVAGHEIVQLYVSDQQAPVKRPPRELKGFQKVFLQPGEEATVSFHLDKRAFSYYDVGRSAWHVETGDFTIAIGKSSREIVLSQVIHVVSTDPPATPRQVTRNTTVGDLLRNPVTAPVIQGLIARFSQATGMAEDLVDPSNLAAAMLLDLPLRALVIFSQGYMGEEQLAGLIYQLNAGVRSE